MAISAARSAAYEILLRVERENSYASELLHSPTVATLSSRDHGLATELAMGVLRWRSLLDRRLAEVSAQKVERLDKEVLTALRLGVYQLQFLSRIPARAAIFESVELVKAARKRSAAAFVNAVLRKVSGAEAVDAFAEIEKSPDSGELARNAAHPSWMVERWIEHYGLVAVRRICVHNQTVPETSLHIHGNAFQKSAIDAELSHVGAHLAPGRLLAAARQVVAGDVRDSRAYKEGRVSIQDEGSQLVAMLVGRGEKILDCCAAPGGKTTLIAGRDPQARVVATELHIHRARLLQSLARADNVRVIAADARHLPFLSCFDRVLADVPCSGTGTLARNPEIKWRLRAADLQDLQERQMAILKSGLEKLVPGGRLVYSTCSMEREENEVVVEEVLRNAADFVLVDLKRELEQLLRTAELAWMDVPSLLKGAYLRTIPGVHPCDGFFAAMIERRSNVGNA